jgi:hypothetical protein
VLSDQVNDAVASEVVEVADNGEVVRLASAGVQSGPRGEENSPVETQFITALSAL